MKEYVLKIRAFNDLTTLRNQWQDFIDSTGFYPTKVVMSQKQYIKYADLLSERLTIPTKYKGAIIEVRLKQKKTKKK